MKEYKIQIRRQKNSQSCVPLNSAIPSSETQQWHRIKLSNGIGWNSAMTSAETQQWHRIKLSNDIGWNSTMTSAETQQCHRASYLSFCHLRGSNIEITLVISKSCGEVRTQNMFFWLGSKDHWGTRRPVRCRLCWRTLEISRARIFKLLRSPRIDSKEPIPPDCVAWARIFKRL